MIELYDFAISGNCYKVRLLLALLKIDYHTHTINLAMKEQKSAEFLALNPFGQVPALKDGDNLIRDSQAILVYLARTYGAAHWFPVDNPIALAQVVAWLSTAANEVARGPGALRGHYKLGREINLTECEKTTATLLAAVNQQLERMDWLAGDLSIADIAIYPYIALAPEGKIDLLPYPQIIRWLARIEGLPGCIAMPGIEPRR